MNLTAQEFKVARLVTMGFSEKEIASKLFVSEKTIHTHTYNIRKKIGARSAVDIARKYIVSHPKQFILSLAFLLIQSHIIFNISDMELRRPIIQRTVRISRKIEA